MSDVEKIYELIKKEKEDSVSSVACDVLRAMVILHGSAWQSDLQDTLTGLWSLSFLTLDRMIDKESLVPEALKQLNVLGLIQSEKKLRSDLSRQEPVEDELHSVKNLRALIVIFGSDHLVEKYRREIMGYGAIGR
ncbi:MAG: hypothetical protein QXX08_04740 [Candidatus Bathyarchaeia archaeon]